MGSTAERQKAYGRKQFETVIIGGGIAGVSLAYWLAAYRASDIALYEASALASGCTAGSMGGVRQQFNSPLEIELSRRGREFWSEFAHRFDGLCEFHADGYLLVTGDTQTLQRLSDAAALQSAMDAGPVSMLNTVQIATRWPWLRTDGLVGGCWTPQDGHTNPTDGVYAMASAARRAGVQLHQDSPVSGISQTRDGWRLSGTFGDVWANRVVVAAGLGSAALVEDFGVDLRIRPLVLHAATTTAIAPSVRLTTLLDLDSGFFLQREGPGCLVSILDPAVEASKEKMLERLAETASVRVPFLSDLSVQGTYSASVDLTDDGKACVGEIEPGLWVMAGFDGHGTMHSPAVSEELARMWATSGEATLDLSSWDPRREFVPPTERMSSIRDGST